MLGTSNHSFTPLTKITLQHLKLNVPHLVEMAGARVEEETYSSPSHSLRTSQISCGMHPPVVEVFFSLQYALPPLVANLVFAETRRYFEDGRKPHQLSQNRFLEQEDQNYYNYYSSFIGHWTNNIP